MPLILPATTLEELPGNLKKGTFGGRSATVLLDIGQIIAWRALKGRATSGLRVASPDVPLEDTDRVEATISPREPFYACKSKGYKRSMTRHTSHIKADGAGSVLRELL